MENCLFCDIISKKVPADFVYEDENYAVFKDIHPVAPFHVLVVPKTHIPTVNHLAEKDEKTMGGLILTAQKVAQKNNIEGYKLLINVGKDGGQIIDHIHLHLMSGRTIHKSEIMEKL